MSTPSAPPPAWYPDPYQPGGLRWWDGLAWTPHASGPAADVGPGGALYATFWVRAGALILDGLILAIPTYALVFALGGRYVTHLFDTKAFQDSIDASSTNGAVTTPTNPYQFFDLHALAALLLISVAVTLVVGGSYAIGLVGRYGRTLGQRIVGIRVVDADGGLPGYGRATRRWLIPAGCSVLGAVPFVGTIGSLVLLLDYLSMTWSKKKQCWHDVFAGTYVVRST